MARLSDCVDLVLDAFVDVLRASLDDEDLGLVGIKQVVRGDRSRPMPDVPALWVVPQAATFSQDDYGEESWVLPVSVAAIVKDSKDPAAGSKLAQDYTARARAVVLASRDLLRSLGPITDVTSQSFDPAARTVERNRVLFWAEAVVRVTLTVNESAEPLDVLDGGSLTPLPPSTGASRMRFRFELRRGTAAEWASDNPVLLDGEPGVEGDTRRTKYGDGSARWNDLPYASGGGAALVNEDLTAQVDGAQTIFTTTSPFAAGSVQLYLNGLMQRAPGDYAETTDQTFMVTDAPESGDSLVAVYVLEG